MLHIYYLREGVIDGVGVWDIVAVLVDDGV